MARYRVSKKAQDDIRNIGRYTQQKWGKAQRRKYLSGMNAQLQFLADNPNLAVERDEFVPPVRLFRYQSHLIVFLADESGILIVRVLHENMDVANKLDR
ncbi:MAG: type II toxin-antitoxin system RelE/ParE family toxin [Alphaproteobacteria bacterium]